MKSIICEKYGVLVERESEIPELTAKDVRVKVRAISINPADWYAMEGKPYVVRPLMGLLKPKDSGVGADYAGTVEAVGKDVTRFHIGDEVFGRSRAFAEYISIPEDGLIVKKPMNVSFEEAAAVPVAALTALQSLRDKANLQPGQRVLINGASGGVGTFTVQIAKAWGAKVTGVCSTRNLELAKSLGADHVIDYSTEDFTRSGVQYDSLIDIAGRTPWRRLQKVLKKEATVVVVGASHGSALLGPLGHIAKILFQEKFSSRNGLFFIAKPNVPDLLMLSDLLAKGNIRPIIDKRFLLAEVNEAFRYLGEGHAQGKIVINF